MVSETGRAALRRVARAATLRSGALSVLHRARNRDCLTVVTLHRVLGVRDPRWAEADPRYTISDELFDDCLRYLQRHYTVVGIDDLRAALDGRPLPPHPLLVTLDDGWRDNADHALPALTRAGLPAVVFVVAGTIGAVRPFWQERLHGAWRTGAIGPDDLGRLAAAVGHRIADDWDEAALRSLVARLTPVPPADRARLLARVPEGTAGRAMMDPTELRRLIAGGVGVGAHGATHEPIPWAPDLSAELAAPRETIAAALGVSSDEVDSMSFPHGRFDEPSLAAAAAAGYRLVFTSESHLNECPGRTLTGARLGRIGLPGPEITDAEGALSPSSLALWLFRRPVRPAGRLPEPHAA